MAHRPLDTYLNDHLAGAMFGSDLAERLCDQHEGTTLGDVMATIAPMIEEDRQTLIDLMQRMGTTENRVKQATTWMAEKTSRVTLSGLTSGAADVGTLMALETLCLGVYGKLGLWKSLVEVGDQHAPLAATDLHELIARARSQHEALERERLVMSRRALDTG